MEQLKISSPIQEPLTVTPLLSSKMKKAFQWLPGSLRIPFLNLCQLSSQEEVMIF